MISFREGFSKIIEIKKKIKICSLIILISIFSSVIFLSVNFYNNPIQKETKQELLEFEIKQPKVSKYWDEDDVTFIYIKNDNWSATDLEWIQNRTGSPTDPHIIENVTINGQGLYNCIKIENCVEHFIIRNCTLYNAGNSRNNASINIVLSTNGTIINNTCYSSRSGIRLYESDDMLISNNTLFSNYNGIYLHYSDNNNITGNRAYNNNNTGIWAESTSNNTIHNNYLNKNFDVLSIWYCTETTISENRVYDYEHNGIELRGGNNNTVLNNYINDFNFGRIYISNDAIWLWNTLNNTVEGNKLYYVVNGIHLKSANYTIIKDNIIYFYGSAYKIENCNSATNKFINNTLVNLNPFIEYYEDDDYEEGEEDNTLLMVIISLSVGSAAVASGLSVYYFKKIRLKKIKKLKFEKRAPESFIPKKTFKRILNKEKILKALKKKNFLKVKSPLNFLDLTLLSEEFLKTVEKFGFKEADKIEFIKEMLGYSLEERDEFIKIMLKDLNLD